MSTIVIKTANYKIPRSCVNCGCSIACSEGDEYPLCEECVREAAVGLEESYVDMVMELEKISPYCHFTMMEHQSGEPEHYPDFWECKHCGHTKGMDYKKGDK